MEDSDDGSKGIRERDMEPREYSKLTSYKLGCGLR